MRISGYDVEILHERCGTPSSSSVLEADEGSKVYDKWKEWVIIPSGRCPGESLWWHSNIRNPLPYKAVF